MKPVFLGVIIKGVKQTRRGELLIEIVPAADYRAKLSSAIFKVFANGNCVCHFVPRTEFEGDLIEANVTRPKTKKPRTRIVASAVTSTPKNKEGGVIRPTPKPTRKMEGQRRA